MLPLSARGALPIMCRGAAASQDRERARFGAPPLDAGKVARVLSLHRDVLLSAPTVDSMGVLRNLAKGTLGLPGPVTLPMSDAAAKNSNSVLGALLTRTAGPLQPSMSVSRAAGCVLLMACSTTRNPVASGLICPV